MNVIQKAVDAGLLLLAVLIVGSVVVGVASPRAASPTAASLEAFTYAPGALVCDLGQGPKWDELKGMVGNLR